MVSFFRPLQPFTSESFVVSKGSTFILYKPSSSSIRLSNTANMVFCKQICVVQSSILAKKHAFVGLCRQMVCIEKWYLWKSDICGKVIFVEKWSLWKSDICGKVIFGKKWYLRKSDLCGKVIFVEKWSLWKSDLCGKVIFVETWYLRKSDLWGKTVFVEVWFFYRVDCIDTRNSQLLFHVIVTVCLVFAMIRLNCIKFKCFKQIESLLISVIALSECFERFHWPIISVYESLQTAMYVLFKLYTVNTLYYL